MIGIAGLVIHSLQDKDFILMLLLGFLCVVVYLKKRKSPNSKIYFIGFIISAIGGFFAEHWGIANGLWEYHELPDGRNFPYWLPFAWGLAFYFLYDFEKRYVTTLQLKTLPAKIALTIFASALLPTVGEIVAVKTGVWTYYGSYKLLGIPLYAIALLVLFHTCVFLLLCLINAYWKMNDPVFVLKKPETR